MSTNRYTLVRGCWIKISRSSSLIPLLIVGSNYLAWVIVSILIVWIVLG